MTKKAVPGFSTRAIHAGNEADPSTGAVAPPIFATSTYAQEELGKTKGYDYSRAGNPTRTRLEENLASLEGGIASRVFASGMAAVGAICHLMKAGDHMVASNNLYGGVPRLFDQIMTNFGLEFTYVDSSDPRNVERAIRKNTRYVYIETPTNPLMGLTDIAAVSAIAQKRGCEVVVDNTFMSPYFQQPIQFGADIVMHSTTEKLPTQRAPRGPVPTRRFPIPKSSPGHSGGDSRPSLSARSSTRPTRLRMPVRWAPCCVVRALLLAPGHLEAATQAGRARCPRAQEARPGGCEYMVKQNRDLLAANARLTKKLKNAELIIEVQKKVAALLGNPTPDIQIDEEN